MDVRRVVNAAIEDLEPVRNELRHDEDLSAHTDQLLGSDREECAARVDQECLSPTMVAQVATLVWTCS